MVWSGIESDVAQYSHEYCAVSVNVSNFIANVMILISESFLCHDFVIITKAILNRLTDF